MREKKTAPPRRSLAVKIGAIGCALLVLALAAIGLTLRLTWSLEGGAAAINEAGRMRMQTWKLAQSLPAADTRQRSQLLEQFDAGLVLLKSGDPERPLYVPRDDTSQAALGDVQQRWQVLRKQWSDQPSAGPSTSPALVAAQAETFVQSIDQLVTAIELQLASWTTWLNTAQLVMMALAISAALALLYAAQLLVFGPLSRLQAAQAQVERGDFSARVTDSSRDEFGEVARGFNRMAHSLQDLYQSLEQRVQQKTEHGQQRGGSESD